MKSSGYTSQVNNGGVTNATIKTVGDVMAYGGNGQGWIGGSGSGSEAGAGNTIGTGSTWVGNVPRSVYNKTGQGYGVWVP